MFDKLLVKEEFILNPTVIGGKSRGFLIPKKRIKLECEKKYIVIILEVEDICKQLI